MNVCITREDDFLEFAKGCEQLAVICANTFDMLDKAVMKVVLDFQSNDFRQGKTGAMIVQKELYCRTGIRL